MTTNEFRAFMLANNLTFDKLAELLRINPRTPRRWAAGQDIPFTAQMAMIHLTKCV